MAKVYAPVTQVALESSVRTRLDHVTSIAVEMTTATRILMLMYVPTVLPDFHCKMGLVLVVISAVSLESLVILWRVLVAMMDSTPGLASVIHAQRNVSNVTERLMSVPAALKTLNS